MLRMVDAWGASTSMPLGVLGKVFRVCGVWGVGTLLGPEEMTVGCFLGAARCRVRCVTCSVVVLVCCLRIV